MIRNIILWLLAVFITILSVVFQKKTGPTSPVTGKITMEGTTAHYEFLRSHAGESDQPVIIQAADSTVTGQCIYRRYKTNDPWTVLPMTRNLDDLVVFLPYQPPAGKLEYHVELIKNQTTYIIPKDRNVVTRFRGAVPAKVFLWHVLFIFFAMLLSMRAGLETIGIRPHNIAHYQKGLKRYTIWTTIFLFLGGFIFGPLMQKYAFDTYWSGFPFGIDVTDNKMLIATIAWLIAFLYAIKDKDMVVRVRVASLITLLIFMIPHSFLGSELNYNKLDQSKTVQTQK
jgi:hypothetical protein